MKGQNWQISCTENIVKISRYILNIAISRYFQMMQYIAFAIYRDTKRSPLVLTLAVFSPRLPTPSAWAPWSPLSWQGHSAPHLFIHDFNLHWMHVDKVLLCHLVMTVVKRNTILPNCCFKQNVKIEPRDPGPSPPHRDCTL